jgi:SAM-dependent methyltransferase
MSALIQFRCLYILSEFHRQKGLLFQAVIHFRRPNVDFEFIIDIKCLKQQFEKGFALTETVCEKQIVISANIEPLPKKEIPNQEYEILDVGCGWRKRGVQASNENLPFKDDVFDKVITWNVFEHALNAFAFLKEMLRVVKPNGLIEIVTDNPMHYAWSVLKQGKGGTEHLEFAADHYAIFYPENIRRMFRLLGIEESAFSWEVKRPWIITYPFANLLVKLGIWREECLYWTYKIVGRKTSCEF